MKYCYLVLIFLFCTVCKAQQPTHKIDSLQRALQNHTKKDSVRVKMLVELFMSKFYGSPDSSLIKYPEEALVISRAINFKKGIALSYGRMGIYYQYLKGDSKKGLSYYYKVLTYLDSIKDPSLQVWKIKNEVLMYGNIANINSDMGSFKKSIEFQHKALSLSQKNNLPVPVQLYTNLGIAYLQLKNYAQSEAYLRLALNNAEQNKDLLNQAVVLSNLSICLLRQQKTTEALSSIKKSLLLNETLKSDLVSSSALINAGVIYTTLGDYEKAEQYDKQALVFSKKFGYQMMEREALFALYENYVKQENYKDALTNFEKYTALKDTLDNLEKRTIFASQEIQFEADKKQAISNQEINYQKQLKNYSLIAGFIFLLSSVGIFIFYKKYRDGLQKQNELLYKAKVADTDMRILRLQMNPHFIFNSLNSISDYIGKNDTKSADYYLSKFAKLMRGILENSEEKEIPLADELKMLELYMHLESSRLSNQFTYEIKISADVDAQTTLVPPLILQPFVENSIWHGLADKDGDGKIIIEVNRDKNLLNCIVQDNGVGRNESKTKPGKSYGMKITKDRLELLNKLKNTQASINLIDLEKGTRVEIKLPFETE